MHPLPPYQCPVCDETGLAGKRCPRHDLFLVDPACIHEDREARLLGHFVADKFAVLGLLGVGGMAHVYWAIEYPSNKRRALKVMKGDLTANLSAEQRFMREGRTIRKLVHPHLIRCYEFGLYDHTAYMAMEILHGVDLRTLLARRRPPVDEAIALIGQTLAGLAAVHEAGLLHRDLKPGNLMVCQTDGTCVVKIIDFGLAKSLEEESGATLTAADDVLGTARYIAPDNIKGSKALTPAADVYSVGVIFYEILAGKPPFDAPSPIKLFQLHLTTQPPDLRELVAPGTRQTLVEFVEACLIKDPTQRFADGQVALAAFEALGLTTTNDIQLSRPGDHEVGVLESTPSLHARTTGLARLPLPGTIRLDV